MSRTSKKRVTILILIAVVAVILIIAAISLRSQTQNNEEQPIFYSDEPDLTRNTDSFSLEDYYITNKVAAGCRYYIDEQSVLWGYGNNAYGQLGNGEVTELGVQIESPIQISSEVVSVDCSVNGYFTIYLTADGRLYGMGIKGLLLPEYDKGIWYSINHYDVLSSPVLLMEDVSYARAGKNSIVALKEDGSVWWWGKYDSTTLTNASGNTETGEMESSSPQKILDHCIYAVTGDHTGAAIAENGDLYMWGLNVFGECGVPVSTDDYVRSPQKVLENVRMVWPEKIEQNSIMEDIPEQMSYDTTYEFNSFVLLENGTIMAAGHRIGEKEKTTAINGDVVFETCHTYSDAFLPVTIKAYSYKEIQHKLGEIELGMSAEEVEKYLIQNGIQFSYVNTDNAVEETAGYQKKMMIGDSSYFFYFDKNDTLVDMPF